MPASTPFPDDTQSADTVCVIIAAYNAQDTITRAIKSALMQREVSQIIMVDDASTDTTVTTARSACDGSNRLRIIEQPHNQGPAAARNTALQNATATWVTILDADDFFLEGRITGLLLYKENADMIADNMWQVPHDDIEGPYTSLLNPAPTKAHPVSFEIFVASNISRRNRYRGELGFIKPLIRREFLEKNHITYREDLRLGEDFELYARCLAAKARMLLVPSQGYISVVRPNSLSGMHSEHDLKQLRDSDVDLLKNLTLNAQEQQILRKHYLSIDCRFQWRMLILAVKKRDASAIIKSFARPWPVPAYLMGQLVQQLWLRTVGRRLKTS